VIDDAPDRLAESEPESTDDELPKTQKFVSYEKDGSDRLDSSGR
jgi:hypothetical protein